MSDKDIGGEEGEEEVAKKIKTKPPTKKRKAEDTPATIALKDTSVPPKKRKVEDTLPPIAPTVPMPTAPKIPEPLPPVDKAIHKPAAPIVQPLAATTGPQITSKELVSYDKLKESYLKVIKDSPIEFLPQGDGKQVKLSFPKLANRGLDPVLTPMATLKLDEHNNVQSIQVPVSVPNREATLIESVRLFAASNPEIAITLPSNYNQGKKVGDYTELQIKLLASVHSINPGATLMVNGSGIAPFKMNDAAKAMLKAEVEKLNKPERGTAKPT